jgi:hypothetical protein
VNKSRKKRSPGRNHQDPLGVATNVAKEPKNWALAIALTLSVAFHVLLGGRAPAEAAAPTFEHPSTINMEVLWQDTVPEPEPPAPEPASPTPERVEPVSPRRPQARRPRETSQGPPSEGAISSADVPSDSSSGEPGPTTEAPPAGVPTVDFARLRPSAVAQGTFGPQLQTREDEEASLEAALNADLYRIANAANYDTVRPSPELRETGDGGYTYAGHLFAARISPSGEVTFDDAANFGYSGLGGPGGSVGLGFSFDISTAAEQAAGNDPHSAERRWFMEETRSVRHRLAAQARAQIQGRGLVRLRRQLRAIWDAEKPTEQRREEIFRLWDSCEEDEVGAQARAAIIEFVQAHTGVVRADVFPTEQLRRLNARRVSREAFAPYRAVYEE